MKQIILFLVINSIVLSNQFCYNPKIPNRVMYLQDIKLDSYNYQYIISEPELNLYFSRVDEYYIDMQTYINCIKNESETKYKKLKKEKYKLLLENIKLREEIMENLK